MILRVGGADFEAEALRHRILEAVPLLSHLTADSEEGEDVVEAEGAGRVEGEDLEEQILEEASRVISAVEGPCIIRWTRPTSRFNSGVSQSDISTLLFVSLIHNAHIFQTDHRRMGGTPPLVGVEDHLQNPVETIRPGDVEVAVVMEATPRNFQLPHHCRVSGTKSGRYCGPSSLSGPPRPPHFFKKPRIFLSLQSKIQVGTLFPSSGMSTKDSNTPFL